MPARATARHRTDAGVVVAVTGRRPRRARRVGPSLLLALVLAITSLTITTSSDALAQVPAGGTADR